MIGAPNSLNLNCKVRVTKEAPDSSVSEEIADIFTNYYIDNNNDNDNNNNNNNNNNYDNNNDDDDDDDYNNSESTDLRNCSYCAWTTPLG